MRLGPIHEVTLVVRDLERALFGYVDQLGLIAADVGRVPRQRALDMGDAALTDARCVALRSPVEVDPWLTLLEAADAAPTAPAARRGWIALSLAVADVAALASGLDSRIWPRLDAPAETALADGLQALRVVGADGEVLHLTQTAAAPTPFARPLARCPVDRVYSATLAARDCDTALGFYAGLGLVGARRLAGSPIAFGQLRAGNLLEIDQLPLLPAADATLRCGIRMIGFARSDSSGRRLAAAHDPSARVLAGPEGEAIELV
jgi:catechol 2,3-dioxygenase-like lactoylglutathione lyase family enzyme